MEDLLVCRACLDTEGKLFDMYKYELVNTFEMVTGLQMSSERLPAQLCSFCAMLLRKCCSFQRRCRTAQQLLQLAAGQEHLVTADYIRNIDRETHNLTLPYCVVNTPATIKLEHDHDGNFVTDKLENYNFVADKLENDNFVTDTLEHDNFVNDKLYHDNFVTDKNEHDTYDNHYSYKSDIDFQKDDSDEEPLLKFAKKKRRKKQKTVKEHIETSIKDENDIDMATDVDDIDNFVENDNIVDKMDSIEVIELTREQQVEEMMKRKNSLNYKNSVFKCDRCFKGFMTDITYKNHMTRHDPAYGPLSCAVCGVRWRALRPLRAHERAHARRYACKRCAHVAGTSHSAREHLRWHQGVTYICNVCGATFSKSTSRLTHVRLAHPSAHACDICGHTYVSHNGLRLHKKKAHRENCEVKQENKCDVCGAQFASAAALGTHAAQPGGCGDTLRPCVHCGESFRTEESLKEHFRTHQKHDAVKCGECGRRFAHARSYAAHYARAHAHAHAHAHAAPPRGKGPPLVCELCGRTCISKATLVYHQRTHTGEKPYQCSECPKRFSVQQRLQIHLRTHTGERPFKCALCHKGFRHKAALNRHVRVHTGAKPYACAQCGKAFSQSNSLKTHINAVHYRLPAPYRKQKKEHYTE